MQKRECHIALNDGRKRGRREKRTEVSQTGPLTQDTRWAYKVHDNAMLRRERKTEREREREGKSRTLFCLRLRNEVGKVDDRVKFPLKARFRHFNSKELHMTREIIFSPSPSRLHELCSSPAIQTTSSRTRTGRAELPNRKIEDAFIYEIKGLSGKAESSY